MVSTKLLYLLGLRAVTAFRALPPPPKLNTSRRLGYVMDDTTIRTAVTEWLDNAAAAEDAPATSPRGFFDSTTHTPEATPRRRKRTQDKERNYWSRREAVPDDPPRGSILCKARARRAFEAVEPAELNVEDNQEVLVLREELGPLSEGQRSRPTTPGWVFAVSDQNSGYVPRTYLEAEEDLAQSMTVRYVSKAERNTAAYNEAAVGQTTQGDYWVQKMAADLGSDALDVPARPPPSSPGKIDPVTPSQVEKMTAPKLKKALKQRGLSTQGLKGELKARLLKALQIFFFWL